MAEKRMFSISILKSDAFLDMPFSAQALYVQLNMSADDDGLLNNPKTIQRTIGANKADLDMLVQKRFVLAFSSGVVAIKHWKINNSIRKDTYKPTVYSNEFNQLVTKQNKSYTEKSKEPLQPLNHHVTDTIQKKSKEVTQKKQEGKKSSDIFLEYTTNPELITALENFEEMRKSIKSPLTDMTKKMLINKLDELASDDHTKIAILKESTFNNWKGVFVLNESRQKKQKQSKDTSYNLGEFEKMAMDYVPNVNGE